MTSLSKSLLKLLPGLAAPLPRPKAGTEAKAKAESKSKPKPKLRQRASHSRGRAYEDQALVWLGKRGLALITRNYYCRYGEIDLIMRQGNCLVFVEVRARRSSAYGGAAASLTHTKQRRLAITARHFLQQHPHHGPMRFDLIGISQQGLEWIPHAFDGGKFA